MNQLITIWRKLTNPVIVINDIEQYQQARLLASLSLSVVIVSVIGIFFTIPSYTPEQIKLIIPVIGGLLLFLIPYHQSRRGKVKFSSILLAFIATVLIHGAAVSIGGVVGRDILHYYILVTIFTSVFLERYYTVLFLISVVLLIFIFVVLNPILSVEDAIRGPLSFNLFGTAFVSTFIGLGKEHELIKQELIKKQEQEKAQMLIKQEQYTVLRQFIQAMSHDLRTRLSLIGTNSFFIKHLVKDSPKATQAEKRLNNIHTTVHDIDTQISNLEMIINLSDPNSEKINLQEFINYIIGTVSERSTNRNIVIQPHYELSGVSVYCDYNHLSVAIKNLLDNAITHSEGDSTIQLNLRRDDRVLIFEVIDTGLGIAPEDIERIFDIFYKADSARTTTDAGLGLGLTIVKIIADIYGGQITVSSALNQGSTFTLKLPIAIVD